MPCHGGFDRLVRPLNTANRALECFEFSTALPYAREVFTVIETPVFSSKADQLLTDDEREDFAAFIQLAHEAIGC